MLRHDALNPNIPNRATIIGMEWPRSLGFLFPDIIDSRHMPHPGVAVVPVSTRSSAAAPADAYIERILLNPEPLRRRSRPNTMLPSMGEHMLPMKSEIIRSRISAIARCKTDSRRAPMWPAPTARCNSDSEEDQVWFLGFWVWFRVWGLGFRV